MEPGRGFWEGGLAGQGAPGFHFRAWPHGSRRLTREGGGAQVHQGGAPVQHHSYYHQRLTGDPEVVLVEELLDWPKEQRGAGS